jgi:serine palmitoyltransferase
MTSGNTRLHTELEELVAKFVGKPAAILFGMGYVTNSAIIPAVIGKVCCHTLFF